MTRKRLPDGRGLLWLRVAVTLTAWVLLVVYAHRLAHLYQAEIVEVLKTPALRIAATTVLITAAIYLVAVSLPRVPTPGPRAVGVVFFWAALLVIGHSLSHMGFHDAQQMLSAMRDAVGTPTLLLMGLLYALALAMPFVPGVELGLLIMAAFGPVGALVAYGATIGGLGLAYAVGRFLPERLVAQGLQRIGVAVPRDGVSTAMQSMIAGSRAGRNALPRLGALLLDYRHFTLALGLNFPGNSALGGGGGISLLCGLSRQFGWGGFLLTVAIATSPLPVLVLAGALDMEPLLEHHGFLHDLLGGIERLFIHD